MASTLDSMLAWLRIPVLASSGIAVLLSGLLYFKQNEIIYPRSMPPDSRDADKIFRPPYFGISDYEELTLHTPDKEQLHAYLIRPSNKARFRNLTMLMFHGNAGNIGYRLPIAKILAEDLGYNVLMLQYRGYGLSTGTPNEKGLTIDAQTGLDFLRQRKDLRDTKIVIYGQSLGGAVGIGLAAKNQGKGDIAAIVLENTFLSIKKMIPSAFPPAKYLAPLCHQIWPSEEMLPEITGIPILFLSGLKDEIVPPSHMAKLYEICRSEPKVWKALPNGDHNSSVAEPYYFNYIDQFLRDYVIKQLHRGVEKYEYED